MSLNLSKPWAAGDRRAFIHKAQQGQRAAPRLLHLSWGNPEETQVSSDPHSWQRPPQIIVREVSSLSTPDVSLAGISSELPKKD